MRIGSNDLILDHDIAGEGDAVVLIHSGIADRRMWEPQWQPLAERFRVVRPDLRGYGNTPLPPGPYSNVDDVLRLLDVLGIERASFVGSSYGGRVTLDLVMQRPDVVSKLVLIATGVREWEWTERTKAAWTAEGEAWERGDLDAVTEANVQTWLSPDAPAEVRDLVRTMQRHAVEVQYAAEQADEPPGPETPVELHPSRIDARTLVIAGLQDLPDFVQIAHMLAREIPHATLVEIDSAHLPNLERPEETTKLLLDFLQS